jgi:hypothetical protein
MIASNAKEKTKSDEKNYSPAAEKAKFYTGLLVLVICSAVVMVVIFLIAAIEDKPQTSDPISESTSPNNGNQFQPSILNAGNISSTNSTTPLTSFNFDSNPKNK